MVAIEFYSLKMAEIAITGTAVSVASLGTQVCQGLLSYYHTYAKFDDDVAKTSKSVENLARRLERIAAFLKDQKGTTPSLQQICQCVEQCQEHIAALQMQLAKFNKNLDPSQIASKLKSQLRRLYFPFREGTLACLRDAVSDALACLGPALDLLELERLEDLSVTIHGTEEAVLTVLSGEVRPIG